MKKIIKKLKSWLINKLDAIPYDLLSLEEKQRLINRLANEAIDNHVMSSLGSKIFYSKGPLK